MAPRKFKGAKQSAEVVAMPDEIDGWFDEGEERSNHEECE